MGVMCWCDRVLVMIGVLNQMELMEGRWREAKEERVQVINRGGNEAVNKNGSIKLKTEVGLELKMTQ